MTPDKRARCLRWPRRSAALSTIVSVLTLMACSEPSDQPRRIQPSAQSAGPAPTSVSASAAPLGTAARPATMALPFYNDATFTPRWLSPNAPEVEEFHKIPPFRLTNQEGDEITERTFAGKIYIADFFFTTCPGICLRMTRNMRSLQDEFMHDEVLFLSHSVTPDIDDVARLKKYAVMHGIDSRKWHLATGDRRAIYRLGRNAYFVDEDQGIAASDTEFLHTENFVLIDQRRHIRGIYNGLNKASLQQLVKDVRYLQREGKTTL